VLIVAFIIPAAAISKMITGTAIPQLGFGSAIAHGPHAGKYLLETLDAIGRDLGFAGYTEAFGAGGRSMQDVIAITMALMVGTAGLPHVIIRFYTVPTVRGARLSERTGLVAWLDKNNDGIIQYRSGNAFAGKPDFSALQGAHGQRLLHNAALDGENELYVDRDIIVLANPEIAGLAPWVIALVAAGALAAALSTASGLLLVIASSISHDLYYRMLDRQASEKKRLLVGRVMIGVAVCIAGYFGMNPPGFVAQVVALAFGLAASSFFPTLVLGIFWKRATREGAITGMVCGIGFTMFYIVQTKFMGVSPWFFGISPEGIGCIGMLVNFVLTAAVSLVTPPPPAEVQEMVESIRIPRGASAAIDH
jgi:cation/acetate symporter